MKLLFLIILLSLLVIIQSLPAQTPDTLWTRTYGEGIGNCVIETSDSGLVIVGEKEGDVYLLKTNSMGDSLWSKSFGDTNSDVGYSIQQTSDDGFIIVGATSSYGAGQNDVWLIRTDEYGDTLWTKTFGTIGDDVGRCVQITLDNGFILVGNTEIPNIESDLWLIRTDSVGDTLWTNKVMSHTQGKFVKQLSDSGFVILGSKWASPFGEDAFLIRANSKGDTLWTKVFDIPVPFNGANNSGDSFINTNYGYLVITTSEPYGVWGIMVDQSGDTLWNRRLVEANPIALTGANGRSVIETSNNCYIIAGGIGFSGGYWPTVSLYLMMIDSEGNILWINTQCQGEGFGPHGLNSVIQTSDSSYVATGCLNANLFMVEISSEVMDIDFLKEEVIEVFELYQNYPNPFNPTTTIAFNLPKTSKVTLKVFNILGEEVTTLVSERLSAGSYTYDWDASNLASGVYLYRLQADKYVETKKMILLK